MSTASAVIGTGSIGRLTVTTTGSSICTAVPAESSLLTTVQFARLIGIAPISPVDRNVIDVRPSDWYLSEAMLPFRPAKSGDTTVLGWTMEGVPPDSGATAVSVTWASKLHLGEVRPVHRGDEIGRAHV